MQDKIWTACSRLVLKGVQQQSLHACNDAVQPVQAVNERAAYGQVFNQLLAEVMINAVHLLL